MNLCRRSSHIPTGYRCVACEEYPVRVCNHYAPLDFSPVQSPCIYQGHPIQVHGIIGPACICYSPDAKFAADMKTEAWE